MSEHVEPAPHEFAANYIFTTHGLRPFFGCDRAVKDGDGSVRAEFTHAGEEWVAKLYYQESGIKHPGDTNPQGTEFDIDNIREYRVKVESLDDDLGERSVNLHLAPRWQGMQVESSDGEVSELSIPDDISEGVNVRVKGSNIAFDQYHDLMRGAFAAVGVRAHYFNEPHRHSNVTDAEMYVRVNRERSGPVHAREGPIARLGHLLESDRSGYRKVVQNDTDERGRDLPGYYHTVTLGAERVRRAFDGHTLPKEIKHYYAREAFNKDDDDPLAHPKVGSSYQVNRWDGKLGVEPDDLERLETELTETVLSTLAEAGVQTHTGPTDPFVEDAYFSADPHEYDDTPLVDLGLAELESHQENVVIKHLADGFSPVEWESLETLITDGGQVSPTDIADQNNRHVDSVRRALDRIPDLVEHSYGEVKLRSDHIAELVADAVNEAKDSIRRAVETGAKARLAAERGQDYGTSALMAYCANMGIDVDDSRDARLLLRMDTTDWGTVKRRLKELADLWENSGRDPARLREASVKFGDGSHGQVWKFLS